MVWQHNHSDPECSPFNQPDYLDDPGKYWDWADKCIVWKDPRDVGPDIPPLPCKPRMWTDVRGNCWKEVCTEYGPRLESCGRGWGPLPPDSIKLLSVGYDSDGLEVKVARECAIETQIIPGGKVPISKVAFALMADAELPSGELSEIDAEYWDRMQAPETSGGAAAD